MGDITQNTTLNNEPGGNPGEVQEQQDRTFTQDEVNEIVQKRLAKERDRLSKLFQEEQKISELDEREQNILKKELRFKAVEELEKNGLPRTLVDLLDCSSEEALTDSMQKMTVIFRGAVSEMIKPYARQTVPLDTGHIGRGADPLRAAFDL